MSKTGRERGAEEGRAQGGREPERAQRPRRAARELQRRRGNAHLERAALARSGAPLIQPKLVVTQPGDRHEQEADRAAAGLSATAPGSLQRRALSPVAAAAGLPAPPAVEAGIGQARGGGQPLPAALRDQMEGALGADFGGVRLHTGPRAHALSEALHARAFTTGRDIFFREGAYRPGSPTGRALLAHELAHVVQQGGGSAQPEARVVQRYIAEVDKKVYEAILNKRTRPAIMNYYLESIDTDLKLKSKLMDDGQRVMAEEIHALLKSNVNNWGNLHSIIPRLSYLVSLLNKIRSPEDSQERGNLAGGDDWSKELNQDQWKHLNGKLLRAFGILGGINEKAIVNSRAFGATAGETTKYASKMFASTLSTLNDVVKNKGFRVEAGDELTRSGAIALTKDRGGNALIKLGAKFWELSEDEGAINLIHEASHAQPQNPKIEDFIYTNSTFFHEMPIALTTFNAPSYEQVARWVAHKGQGLERKPPSPPSVFQSACIYTDIIITRAWSLCGIMVSTYPESTPKTPDIAHYSRFLAEKLGLPGFYRDDNQAPQVIVNAVDQHMLEQIYAALILMNHWTKNIEAKVADFDIMSINSLEDGVKLTSIIDRKPIFTFGKQVEHLSHETIAWKMIRLLADKTPESFVKQKLVGFIQKIIQYANHPDVTAAVERASTELKERRAK